jgi:hypothetical protein
MHIAALRIHSRHDMPDSSVLTAGIQRLQHDQQSIPFVGIEQVLEFPQPVNRLLVRFLIALYSERIVGITVFQPELAPGLHQEMSRNIHCSSVVFSAVRGKRYETGLAAMQN